jgi:hypothetical protein
MPIKTNRFNNHSKKWNLFENEIEKTEYIVALVKSGKSRAQSAGVRAFMHLYATDEDVRNKVNAIIDDFIVYKENGKPSLL